MKAFKENSLAMARRLRLSDDALKALEVICGTLPWHIFEEDIEKLTDAGKAMEARLNVKKLLEPYEDVSGMGELAVMMAAACRSLERYRELGIGDDIFDATFGCFQRFIGETRRACGRLCFDRGFWTWRQLSLRLFRIGTLEFEYCPQGMDVMPSSISPGSPVLSVHIPSDARLKEAELAAGYEAMTRFFAEHGAVLCTDGRPEAALCTTWLLSPALNALLPEGSGIRQFASDYEIYDVDTQDTEFYNWLFGGCTDIESLPGNTSLQRSARRLLQTGGKIGQASGRLSSFAQLFL